MVDKICYNMTNLEVLFMNHIGTQKIESSRLLLRKFEIQDVEDMYNNWASDLEVTKFLTWQAHQNKNVTLNILQEWIQQYAQKDYYNWAIVLKEENQVIGNIAVVLQNEKAQLAQIGYCLSRKFWHQGIMSETLSMVIDYLFDQVEYECIQSHHNVKNPYSGAVMKKCGMKYEGTLRHSDWDNQGICDACYYSILRSEKALSY